MPVIIIVNGDDGDGGIASGGAHPAGDFSSSAGDETHIFPFLGYNQGNYSTNPADLPPIPFEWIVAPTNVTAGQCPSKSGTTTAFGVANIIVMAMSLILGCRPFVNILSFGLLGKRGGKSWRWTWTLSLAFQLLSNVCVSLIVVRTPGYEHLATLNVFALYSSRPRINAWWTAVLRSLVAVNMRHYSEKAEDAVEYPYLSSYSSTAWAEFVTQLVSAIFTGVTWQRFPNAPIRAYMRVIVGIVCATPVFNFLGILICLPAHRLKNAVDPQYYTKQVPDRRTGEMVTVKRTTYHDVWVQRCAWFLMATVMYGVVYMIQWIYWDMFLNLPGALWCPPKLVEETAIWSGLSTLSVLVGSLGW